MTTMSPELALVDPELRAYAVARLPPVRPFSFLELRLLSIDEAPPAAPSFRASAAFAYLLLAIVRTFVFDALVFASVVACVLLANLFA
jgi:hypothetical protein